MTSVRSSHMNIPRRATYHRVGAVALASVMGLACSVHGAAQLGLQHRVVRTVRLPLPETARGEAVEPSIAVSSDNPQHITIGGYSPQSIDGYYWSSLDGGRSWITGELQVPGRHGAVDPSVRFISDCEVLYLHGDPGEPRKFLELWEKDLHHEGAYWVSDGGLGLQRSTDCGRTYHGTQLVTNPSGQLSVDKPWLAVDRYPSSKFVGSVYALWSVLGDVWDERPQATDIHFMYSRDGGAHFSPAKQLLEHGYAVQAVVRPDGTLDLAWTNRRWKNREIWHMTSIDGGVSFSDPEILASTSGDTVIDLPSLAVSRDGSILATWIQTTDLEPQCGRTPSHVYYSVLKKGSWSPPQPLEPNLPLTISTRFPAAAATDDAFWMLAYRVTRSNTSVVLYRQAFGSTRFSKYAVLATRRFGTPRFHPGPMWRDCSEGFKHIFFPGDYVGLAGTHNTVAAAYVFSRDDDGKTPGVRNVYVSVVPMKMNGKATTTAPSASGHR
jgi:hypothetical protein